MAGYSIISVYVGNILDYTETSGWVNKLNDTVALNMIQQGNVISGVI